MRNKNDIHLNPPSTPIWSMGLLTKIARVRLKNKPVPLMTHWEITYKCNLKCVFCTTRLHPSAWSPETTTDEALDIVDKISAMGTKILNIVGGEPTNRSDLSIILKYARSKGIRIAITSHGVINDEKRSWLMEADVIRISLEGPEELNSTLRVAPEKYNATNETIETLRYLVKNGRKPLIGTIFTSRTTDTDIVFLVGICRELDIKMNLKLVVAYSFGDKMGGFSAQEAQLRAENTADICLPLDEGLRRIEKYRQKYSDCITNGEPETDVLKSGGLEKIGCRSMDTALCLKADGSVVLPCIEFPKHIVKSNNLSEVFFGKLADRIRIEQGSYWFCNECQLSCMIHASALISFKPLLKMARSYLSFSNIWQGF